MDSRSLARHQLDRRIAGSDGSLAETLAVPRAGWIRAIRDSLGMSSRQLASRLRVSQPTVVALERSERARTISLQRLSAAADVLGCDLVYGFVPRAGSLDATVESRAQVLAIRRAFGVTSHMDLEDQSLEPEMAQDLIASIAERLRGSRELWDLDDGDAG